VTAFEVEQFKVFQEVEAIDPDAVFVLKLSGENLWPIFEHRLQTSLLESKIDPSASELVIGQLLTDVERLQEFLEAIRDVALQIYHIDANVPADGVFYACANQIDPVLPRCGEPSEEQPPGAISARTAW
jgi:hypothetical protein